MWMVLKETPEMHFGGVPSNKVMVVLSQPTKIGADQLASFQRADP